MTLATSDTKTIAVALTGASGMPYGLRLVECLLAAGCRVWLLYSQVAQIVARQEMDLSLPARPFDVEAQLSARFGAAPGQLRVFGREEWFAPPASGSNPPDAMVVCPCSMGSLMKQWVPHDIGVHDRLRHGHHAANAHGVAHEGIGAVHRH